MIAAAMQPKEEWMAATQVYAGAARSMGGTLGGVFRQTAGAADWEHLTNGLPESADVHAITVHPENPEIVYIGTTKGLYRSTDRGARWQRQGLPADADIWSVCFSPKDPRIIFVGGSPPVVFRSDDAGETWRRTADPGLPNRVIMDFSCRVMRLAVDPNSPDDVYATLEANGAMRSRDGGESWEDCSADLIRFCEQPRYRSRIGSQTEIEGMLDGHALAVTAAAPGSVFLANRMGLFRSDDRGRHWRDLEIGQFSPLTYGRDIRVSPHDPKVFYSCLSPAARSSDGSIYRSDDVGLTWQRFDHDVKAEATMMGVAPHPLDPNQIYAVSRFGQVFGTRDGGRTWHETRLPEGVRDVYAVACG
jgi:photosystem II stability/assembly factor-like uncharacterized protein